MNYRVYNEKEKEELLDANKKDIIKSSIELAIGVALTFGFIKFGQNLSDINLLGKITSIASGIAAIGLDFSGIVGLCIRMMDRDSIQNFNMSDLYEIEEKKVLGEKMIKGQVIETENGSKYAIAEVINYNNQTYVYIINIANNQEIRFGEITPEKINFVNDEELISHLMFEVFKKNNNN